jgi:hypothetical protein
MLITSVDDIYTGINIAKNLDEKDRFAIMLRDSQYQGSWDQMLKDMRKTRPIFESASESVDSIVGRTLSGIRRLKQCEEENNINLADYCIVGI